MDSSAKETSLRKTFFVLKVAICRKNTWFRTFRTVHAIVKTVNLSLTASFSSMLNSTWLLTWLRSIIVCKWNHHTIQLSWNLIEYCVKNLSLLDDTAKIDFLNKNYFYSSHIASWDLHYVVNRQNHLGIPCTVHSMHTNYCIVCKHDVLNIATVVQLVDRWSHVCKIHVLFLVTPRRSCIGIVSIWHPFMVTSWYQIKVLQMDMNVSCAWFGLLMHSTLNRQNP